jgi:hypothetical protein
VAQTDADRAALDAHGAVVDEAEPVATIVTMMLLRSLVLVCWLVVALGSQAQARTINVAS